ncbi:MAG TPA: hypothetical protein VFA55_09485 [Candidatus Kapabacteria bacterium]|nr:hypothetical protein [Candidatus Kapabacteria bacterium]
MEVKNIESVARFDQKKFVHVPLYVGKRTKALLLCLGSGQEVPPHSHAGFEITLQPLKGKAYLPMPDGTKMLLEPGEFISVDGSTSFNPSNPFPENFEMLIHLVETN